MNLGRKDNKIRITGMLKANEKLEKELEDRAYPGRTAKKNYQNHLTNIVNPADAYSRDTQEVARNKETHAEMHKAREGGGREEAYLE